MKRNGSVGIERWEGRPSWTCLGLALLGQASVVGILACTCLARESEPPHPPPMKVVLLAEPAASIAPSAPLAPPAPSPDLVHHSALVPLMRQDESRPASPDPSHKEAPVRAKTAAEPFPQKSPKVAGMKVRSPKNRAKPIEAPPALAAVPSRTPDVPVSNLRPKTSAAAASPVPKAAKEPWGSGFRKPLPESESPRLRPKESSRQSVAFATKTLLTKTLPTPAFPTDQPNSRPIPHEAVSENGASPSRSGATDFDETQRYLGVVRRILERHKKYPESARRRGVQGKIVLVFSIAPDGSPVKPVVEGDCPGELKDSGLRIVERRRFPPPPTGWKPDARIAFPLHYSLH